MYALGCSDCSSRQSLGLSPLVVATTVNEAAALVGLNSSDPTRDKERIARINATYDAAMAGDAASITCLREMAQGVAQSNDPRTCAVGSKIAAAYAKVKWTEYQARVGAGQVGSVLIGQSNLPTMAAGAFKAALPWGTIAVGGLLLLALRRRR